MKKFYKTEATIRCGDYEYLDGYSEKSFEVPPTEQECVDIVINFWFDLNYLDDDEKQEMLKNQKTARKEYDEQGFFWLPCNERIISNVTRALDYKAMVEHAEKNAA